MRHFTKEQRGAIEEIGFGSLLKINELDIRRDQCSQIADRFDLDTEQFNFNGTMVSMRIKEVAHILGLPSQRDEIMAPPKKHVPDLFEKFKWKGTNKITSSELRNYLEKNKTHG
jgi:hypothetical protein